MLFWRYVPFFFSHFARRRCWSWQKQGFNLKGSSPVWGDAEEEARQRNQIIAGYGGFDYMGAPKSQAVLCFLGSKQMDLILYSPVEISLLSPHFATCLENSLNQSEKRY
jgi:hypothetical protein